MTAKPAPTRLPKGIKKISLRPYVGTLYVARTRKAYERAHIVLFGEPDELSEDTAGNFSTNGNGVYLAYADSPDLWVHELSHVVIHLFEYLQNPITTENSESFCYLLHTLWKETFEYTHT